MMELKVALGTGKNTSGCRTCGEVFTSLGRVRQSLASDGPSVTGSAVLLLRSDWCSVRTASGTTLAVR
jgi:hypothetical protein